MLRPVPSDVGVQTVLSTLKPTSQTGSQPKGEVFDCLISFAYSVAIQCRHNINVLYILKSASYCSVHQERLKNLDRRRFFAAFVLISYLLGEITLLPSPTL